MQTIKTNGREIVAVELLEGAYGFAISDWVNEYTVLDYQYEDGDLEYKILSTTKHNYKIIGLLSELTAEQCEPYVPFVSELQLKDCSITIDYLFKAMLIHNGVDTTKPLLIIEKLK